MAQIQKSSLDFLKQLKKNNNREWFEMNKAAFVAANTNFTEVVAEVLTGMSVFEPLAKDLDPKKTIFRIYKDVRFSKDKTPYKTNFGASINPFGKTAPQAGYYVQISPGDNFCGGGIYHPMNDVLAKVRQEIDYNGAELKKVLAGKDFKKTYGGLWMEDSLATAPKGYPKDHELIEYLKLKSYVGLASFTDDEVLDKSFAKETVKRFKILKPLNDFLNVVFD